MKSKGKGKKNVSLEEQLKHCAGNDCKCGAYDYSECGCDVDWTPREVYELRDQLSTHQALLEKMAGAIDGLLNLLEHEKGTFSKQAEDHDSKFAKQALEEYQTMKKGAGR